MAIVEYVLPLGGSARKRHSHETRRGRVVAFVAQPEVELRGMWFPVARYDMAHVDLYETPRRRTKHFLELSPADAMAFADEDIKENWEEYRDTFFRRNVR